MWKTPEYVFRYFDTQKATRTGRTVSHVRDPNNHAFRRPLKKADVAKNPFVSLSLCVASRKSARYRLYFGSFRISVSDDYNSIWFSSISVIRFGRNYRD